MNSETPLIASLILAGLLVPPVSAQSPPVAAPAEPPSQVTVQAPKAPAAPVSPQAPKAEKPQKPPKPHRPARPTWVEEADDVMPGQTSLKLERGGRLSVTNRFGSVTITGWDRDVVEATADEVDGPTNQAVTIKGDGSHARISLGGLDWRKTGREGTLKVNVPRYVSLDSVEVTSGALTVRDVDGPLNASVVSGDVYVERVGSVRIEARSADVVVKEVKSGATVRTLDGDVLIANVGGPLEVSAISGDVTIENVNSSARVNTADGDIGLKCVTGRVEASTASGDISLSAVQGDVDASSASGAAVLYGPIRANGNYRIKSLSGQAAIYVQDDPPGFTATLTTYSGEIETDVALKIDSPIRGTSNRRLIGRYGDGQAVIVLDSFGGDVRIIKGKIDPAKQCKKVQ